MKDLVRILLFLFVISFSVYQTSFATNVLSEKAEVYLLTASPGNELYSVFGHSAIFIDDPYNQIDRVYNYGTFDFNTPNFYIKFIRGKLHYMLSVAPIRYFEYEYRMSGRGVVKQKLNLTIEEKQKIFEFLEENKKPENKYYLYDFFFDNCATRIRDVFDNQAEIHWHEYPYEFEQTTLRELVRKYVDNLKWEKFGVDVALGMPVDRRATAWEYMFLPDYMAVAFAHAKKGNGENLVLEEIEIAPKTLKEKKPGFFTPLVAFWSLFVLVFFGLAYSSTRKAVAKIWLFILGFAGIALLPLFLFTDHITFNPNFSFLWALPTNALFVFFSYKNWGKKYFKAVFILGVVMLIFWNWLPQVYNAAVIPIILSSVLCSATLAFVKQQKP
ncbi:MAG: DUF4105 domain-containing protein [Bacteroidetes bacterium]|nr:DUF4105 domain-containing protein [Bacteroidota bacterium]